MGRAWIEQQATAAAGKNHIRLIINQAEIFHRGSWKKKSIGDFMTGMNANVFRENPGDIGTVVPA